MIIFESRKTTHVANAGHSFVELFGLDFTNTSKKNLDLLEEGIHQRKDLHLYLDNTELPLYFYKPEAYFHPSHIKDVVKHLLFLSSKGVCLTLESDSANLLNAFGEEVERGNVNKNQFKFSLEVTEDSEEPTFVKCKFDNSGLFDSVEGEPYPIGYFSY